MNELTTQHWRRATVTIDPAALRHNLNKVKEYAPRCKVMAVIKANGYGHGMLAVATHLAEADLFAVAMPEEAFALRQAGIDKPIVVLHGFQDDSELEQFSALDISTVVHRHWQLQRLLKQPIKNSIDCWIKVDTGMHRLGIPPAEVDEYFGLLRNCSHVRDVFLMSHFANADDSANINNNNQLDSFINVSNDIDVQCSMANSAAIMRLKKSHFEIVRPGIMLYGSSPFSDLSADDLGLISVMQFESTLIDIKTISAGESIGYGGTYTCESDVRLGVVAAGYGDGYPRHAKNGTPVWINGECCDLLGRVSMDSLCIDVTGIDANVGDRVVLWGQELSVDRIAHTSDTIAYELLCTAGAHYL